MNLSASVGPSQSRYPLVFSQDRFYGLRKLLPVMLGGFLFLGASTAHSQSILREVWTGIGGASVSDLTSSPNYPNRPDSTNLVTSVFEAPTDIMENYGQRMHGYLKPPVTGNYTFWISSDDNGQLWLSTDAGVASQVLIASVNSWTSPREWTREPNQQSAPIRLEAGKFYYVAALMKEQGGGDNLAVRWLRPDGVDEGPIPAKYLAPYGIAFTPPVITEQPTNTTAVEGQFALFSVKVSNGDLVTYRWQQDGADVPGGTGSILNFGPVKLSDDGSSFQAFLTNNLGATNTDFASLHVLPDTTPPTLAGARNQGHQQVLVTFSERMAFPAATNIANYHLDQGAVVTAAASSADPLTILLTTSTLTYGVTYTLSVTNLTDPALAANPLPDSTSSFMAVEYFPSDVGGPGVSGLSTPVDGGVDVTGGGKDIGGTTDQFQFGWKEFSGDFDMQARLEGVSVSDPFLHAGLMARESLNGNSRFAATFASSPQLGCFFESRLTTGVATSTAMPRTGFPVNYPQTWLRLVRAGQKITGYASTDGLTWTVLGATTFTGLPTKLFFGLAVTGSNDKTTATARFRDLGPTLSKVTGTIRPTREPIGPSSRATGLVFSEIMYHPAKRTDSRKLEYVELFNARSVFQDLTGWRISGDIDFQFPDGFQLAAGDTVVIAASPQDMQAVYGITNVIGPFAGSLPNSEGLIRLRNRSDAIRLEVNYSSEPPWPVSADGPGHSLVLAFPSYGENEARAWAASVYRGGSPGYLEPFYAGAENNLVINEFLAHTDDSALHFIELYNHSNTRIDISGYVLTDDISTNRFRVPLSTYIEPHGFVSWDQNDLGFRLSSAGETIFLVNSNATRVVDAIKFGPQEGGVSSGRSPDGSADIRRLGQPTSGTPNSIWRVEDVVINEIMYNPISGDSDDEYIELYNRGGAPVTLDGWRLEDGVAFTFPTNTSLLPDHYLVVARNVERLLVNYTQLNAANTLGNYSGSLKNSGERVALSRPDYVTTTNSTGGILTNLVYVATAEVTYQNGGRWGTWSDGGGSSLELIDPHADPLRGANWADSDETQKASWATLEFTGRVDNAMGTANRLHITMLGPGECLVDDVYVAQVGNTNLVRNSDFESGQASWSFLGNHSTSTIDVTGAASGTGCLHVRGQGDGDTGPNCIKNLMYGTLPQNQDATIHAKVRWLAGWPEVLFRLHGNGLEFPARLPVPKNLGTPGLPNSRKSVNAGPAIYDVTHFPALPAANEQVKVTCRVSDPDYVSQVQLRYRIDPATTLTTVPMTDNGSGADDIAGDGIYSANLPAQGASVVVAFRVVATDAATPGAFTTFPARAPAQECLVRWGDPIPLGNFLHYHLWFTAATQNARNNSSALNNTFRDCTLVYGNQRVMYNTGFRDKGSPYHGGGGDIAASTPKDEPLLGTFDRVFASTGNGGSEPTGIRSQLASWLGEQLGVPYLHANYMQLYFNFNGSPFREVMEDLEQPNHDYAERWGTSAAAGDLYKVGVWFEFQDDNASMASATSATAQRFTTTPNSTYKTGRYRWNFQRRSNDGNASNYGQLFDIISALNDSSSSYVPRVLNLADMEQWMRVFAFDFSMGNWDAWTFEVGQNMYIYKPDGQRWMLLPWDIDFTFGVDGRGTSVALRAGQDSVMNRAYSNPTFLRMNWRAYQDIVNGPFLAQNFQPQIDARRAALLKNGVGGLSDPRSITTWINARRTYILGQLNTADTKLFAITSNGGSDFTSLSSTTSLDGTAPIAVATIEVNGIPYPVTWTGVRTFRITVPLSQGTNGITLVGKDLRGNELSGASTTINVVYSGPTENPEDFVVINEVQYNGAPNQPNSAFVELFNRSAQTPFDLSGFELRGVNYTFPAGSFIAPGAYMLLAADRAGFGAAYGGTIPVFDTFPGGLDNQGEKLTLLRHNLDAAFPETIISDLYYRSTLPFPPSAAGFGPSLQRIDGTQDGFRPANWAATATNDINRATPGKTNSVAEPLAIFEPLWINEIQPLNVTDIRDSAGEKDPWLELYNSGESPVDLSGLYLTDDYTNLTKWQFPADSTINGHGFLVVWLDGQPEQTRPGEPHTSFKIDPTVGQVALARLQGIANAPAVLDFVDYSDLAEGLSIGLSPDGEPRNRRLFTYVTPGAGNDAELPQPVLDCYVSEEREFVVTWETVPGLVYRLDTRNSFDGDIWTKVTEGVADSTQGSFSKSLGSEPSFYRIVVKPQAP